MINYSQIRQARRAEKEKSIQQTRNILTGISVLVASILLMILSISFVYASPEASKIVKIAQGELGKGEQGGDNRGVSVRKYTRGKEVAWCAGFVSWVLQKSGRGKTYILSAREYWNIHKNNRVQTPRPGDVIVLYRGSRRDFTGHVGIVERVEGKKIFTIEGNVGSFPAKVKRVQYQLGKISNLIGFVRI